MSALGRKRTMATLPTRSRGRAIHIPAPLSLAAAYTLQPGKFGARNGSVLR